MMAGASCLPFPDVLHSHVPFAILFPIRNGGFRLAAPTNLSLVRDRNSIGMFFLNLNSYFNLNQGMHSAPSKVP